jgi:hypothetical protein
MPRGDPCTRQKTKFHETASVFARKVDAFEGGGVAPAKVVQGFGKGFQPVIVATQLHLDFSMRESEMFVKAPRAFHGRFRGRWFRGASK